MNIGRASLIVLMFCISSFCAIITETFEHLVMDNGAHLIKESHSFLLLSHSFSTTNLTGYLNIDRNYKLRVVALPGYRYRLSISSFDLQNDIEQSCEDYLQFLIDGTRSMKCCTREQCVYLDDTRAANISILWHTSRRNNVPSFTNRRHFNITFEAERIDKAKREISDDTSSGDDLITTMTSSMTLPVNTTTQPHPSVTDFKYETTTLPPNSEVYLWLPLIVVVIFTGILVTLIMVGRRGNENPFADIVSDENNRLRIEMNTNQIYQQTDGNPETPPPTYDVIARQTSYVSQISQNSDQVQVPPAYDEACSWQQPGNTSRTNSRNRGVRWRNGSHSVGRSSSQRMNWSRLFSRSHSVTTRDTLSSGNTTTSNPAPAQPLHPANLSSVFNESIASVEGTPRLSRSASQPSISTPIGSLQMIATDERMSHDESDSVFVELPLTASPPNTATTTEAINASTPYVVTPNVFFL